MLVLTRKPGEQIVIGNNVFITVCEVEQGRVKIGIDAPDSVLIDRKEIHDRRRADWRRESVPIGMEPHDKQDADTQAFR